MEGDTHHPETTGTMAALAVIHHHHVTQMSRGLQGHPKAIPKIHQCAMTLQDGPHLQEGVVTLGRGDTTLLTTLGIHLAIIMVSAPPDQETHIVHHAASPSSKWICRASPQVHNEHLYT